MFETFDAGKTRQGMFFFAEDRRQAEFYAGHGSQPRAFHLRAGKVLELVDLWAPARIDETIRFLGAFGEEYDEWIDRGSGEPTDAGTLIESGSLYDYEGTGSGGRWTTLFRLAAAHGYDAVHVMDATDGVVAPVWVVFRPEQIVACEAAITRPEVARKRLHP